MCFYHQDLKSRAEGMLSMNLAKTASRRPAENASKPCTSAEISSPILAGLGSALGNKGGAVEQERDA